MLLVKDRLWDKKRLIIFWGGLHAGALVSVSAMAVLYVTRVGFSHFL